MSRVFDSLPMAREAMRTMPAEKIGRGTRSECEGTSGGQGTVRMVREWNRAFVAEARRIEQFGRVTQALPSDPADLSVREMTMAKAHAVLSGSGDAEVSAFGLRVIPPESVLRGTARMFLKNGASEESVHAWLGELAAFQERFLKAFDEDPRS
jgi:hypothetical protein